MQATTRQFTGLAVAAFGLGFAAACQAQDMDCNTAADVADCTLTVSGSGRYVIEATANVTAGSNSPSVWVEASANVMLTYRSVSIPGTTP